MNTSVVWYVTTPIYRVLYTSRNFIWHSWLLLADIDDTDDVHSYHAGRYNTPLNFTLVQYPPRPHMYVYNNIGDSDWFILKFAVHPVHGDWSAQDAHMTCTNSVFPSLDSMLNYFVLACTLSSFPKLKKTIYLVYILMHSNHFCGDSRVTGEKSIGPFWSFVSAL